MSIPIKAIMGFRSHGGREFSSSSSSLFPLAPPFMVERSIFNLNPDPAVDFPETPLVMSLSGSLPNSGSATIGHEFFPNPVVELNRSLNSSTETNKYLSWKAADSANTYLPPVNPGATASEAPFSVGQCCYNEPANPFEAKPYYYPSYFSPATHGDNSLVSPNDSWSAYQSASLDGSSHGVYAKSAIDSYPTPEWRGWTNDWRNGWTDWNQGKSNATLVFGSFSSKDTNVTGSANYENLVMKGGGYRDTLDLSHSVELLNRNSINMHGGEKPNIIVRAHQTDDKSFLGKDCFSLQADMSVQTQPAIASELTEDFGNTQMSYNASCSKHLSQHDKPYSFSSGSFGATTGMLNDLNVGSAAEVTDFRCSSAIKMNMPSSLPTFEKPAVLNSCENSILLEDNWFTSLENGSEPTKKVVSKDSLAHTFLENYGRDISHTSANFQNLALNTDRSVSSTETSFDTVDQYNAGIDSPCWKGAPTSQCIPFLSSDVFSAYVKNYEERHGYNNQVTHGFLFGTEGDLQSCSRIRKKNTTNDEREHLENSLAASIGSSMISVASEENASDSILKVESCSGVQVPTDIHAVATNVVEDFNSGSFTPEQQSSANFKLTTEEKHSSNHYPADTGVKELKNSERLKSHAAKCALSSPSSPKEVPSRLAESLLEESLPKVDVQNLVNTMQNLSEFLCFHCLNGTIELTEHYQDLLNNVISNIDACLLKNVAKIPPQKEIAFSQSDTLQFVEVEASVEDQQTKGYGGRQPHLAKEMSELSQTQLGNPNADKVTEKYDKFHESIAESLAARVSATTMKEDIMTKELKRILDENFEDEEITDRQALLYRNLWLEAEATLCSNNYKARFNRVKNEMEKCSSQLEENIGGTKKLPNPGVLPNSREESRLPTEAKNDLCYDPSAQNAPTSNTIKPVNDVLVRFHILKSWEEESFIEGSNEKVPSDGRSFSDHNKADEPTGLEKRCAKPVELFQDSLFSGSEDITGDVEGSIMARFNILKSRADRISAAKSDWPLITKIGEDEMVDAKMDISTVLQGSSMVDKMSTPQEPYFPEEEQGSHSFNQFDFLQPCSPYDDTSSDWEHVTDEEFSG